MTDYDWTGTGSGTGAWGDAANWGNAGVPSSGDNANIGVSDTITGTGAADELTVSTSPTFQGTFTIDFAQFYGIMVTVSGMFTTMTSFDLQSGTVTVTSSGDLEADNSSNDAAATIEGTLDVDGGTFDTQGGVNVGDSNAAGALYIEDSAQADFQQSSGTYAALSVDGDGDVYIDNSTLDTGGVSIGYTDEGYMSVDDDSTVTAASLNPTAYAGLGLAKESGTSGELDVTDGSTFTVTSGGVTVGEEGDAILDIDNSTFDDTDSSNGSMGLGVDAGGSGTVDIDGSDVSIAQTLTVGDDGAGTLTIHDISTVDVNALVVANGEDSGSDATRTVTVLDDGTTLTIADALTVGNAGTGTFSISDGATVSADSLDVASEDTSGSTSNSTPSDLMIDGDGSMLTIKGDGSVGDAGYGTMELKDGATASFDNLDIAVQESSGDPDSAGEGLVSQVTVDGDQTALTVTDTLTVGDGGTGYLEVSGGAGVMTDSLVVGAQESSGVTGVDHETGGVTGEPSGIYLHDSGTSLQVAYDAVVGGDGYGFINVFDGSSMSASSIDIAADASSGDPGTHDESYVEVNNADSTLTVGGDVTVGDGGYGGFTVFDGASATVGGNLDIGEQETSGTMDAPSFAGVQDTGSSLKVSGSTTVGDYGNGSFYIGVGGTFTTGGNNFEVGKQADSTGIFEIDSATATFDYSGTLTVGDAGTGTFELEDGATYTTGGDVTLGTQATGIGNIDITGYGSKLTVAGNLVLGVAGTGNLTIGDGGDLDVEGNLAAGNSTIDIEGDPTISGNAVLGIGTVDNAGNVTGHATSTATLANGASLTVQGTLDIGYFNGDTGTFNVTDAKTDLTVMMNLVVGYGGTAYLNLMSNASASAGSLGIGTDKTGDGTMMVEESATLSVSDALIVGQYGTGVLYVQDGSTLNYDGDTIVIAQEAGSIGSEVLFQGQTTTINFDGALVVGLGGTGEFVLDKNIHVTNSEVAVGYDEGSVGVVHLGLETGSTVWTITDDLTDGVSGTGVIELFNQDTMTVGGTLIIASEEGSYGSIINQDSTITISGAATIGEEGTATFSGSRGSLTTFKSDLTFADGEDSSATMTLIGGAEVDASSQQVIVGQDGSATIKVTQGSLFDVSGGDVTLGVEEDSYGEIDVDGSTPNTNNGQASQASEFDTDTLTLGEDGTGVIKVTNGGIVHIADSLDAGYDSDIDVESGGTITIGGDLVFGQAVTFSASGKNQGTNIQVAGNLTTGAKDIFRLDDAGVTFQVSGDAQFAGTQLVDNSNELQISGAMTLSPNSGDTDTFTATDAGTMVIVNEGVTVGDAGTAEIDVLAGASVSSTASFVLGAQAGSSGIIMVDGRGSELKGSGLAVGGTDAGGGGSGTLTISNLGLIDAGAATVWADGVVTLEGGELTTDSLDVDDGKISGYGSISGDTTDDGSIAASGGSLSLSGAVSGSGSLAIDASSSLDVEAVSASIAVAFDPSETNKTLSIGDHAGFLATVAGFTSGDTIDLQDIGYSSSDSATLLSGNILQISYSGGDYDLKLDPSHDYTGDTFHLAADTSSGGMDVTEIACYCRGTLIATQNGEKPVETLAIGDQLMTARGTYRPIKWIGRRAYSGRFIIGKTEILPVCFKAGSLEDNIPARDLWVSPHHAMYLDGVLIEAKDLVNGTSIVRATHVEKVEYFHIELDSHDVILAEGAYSETYFNDDNRGMFHNAHEYARLYPDDMPQVAHYCAPRIDCGEELQAIRNRLSNRAEAAL